LSFDPARRLRELEQAWRRVCDLWLPVGEPGSPWRSSGTPTAETPVEKRILHVSATVLSASAVLDAVGPVLHARSVPFRGPSSLQALKRLNCGVFLGLAEIGKFLTIFPEDDRQATALACELDDLVRGFEGPAIPFALPVATHSSVFWASVPPGLVRLGRARAQAPPTRFHSCEPVSLRGKGGVYRALDCSSNPPRICALKEGLAHGEVQWDGTDGRAALQHELGVLLDLDGTPVGAPAVYDHFEEGGNLYLALEWIAGDCLARMLEPEADQLAVPAAVELGRQCAALLDRIHARGWVWRDLKAANLILSSGGLRPIDFEGCVHADAALSWPWGTPGYTPPEWMRAGRASFAQDLYALGVLLHLLFVHSGLPPPGARRLIEDLTQEDPRRRPTAAQALRALERL
jgi:hypothetical protein